MLPIADGSDAGGSLRNPANFCNVVGFRPSPGRVPTWPQELGWFPISVQGPMARTVEDVTLMLTAIAGPDASSPISIDTPACSFAETLQRDFRGVRIAWSRDFGELPVEQAVTEVIDAQRPTFQALGCVIVDGQPDFRDADDAFKVLRAMAFESKFGPLLQDHRDQIKDTILWNVEVGQRQTGPQIARAELKRTELYHRVRQFMLSHEFLILPVSQVCPFDVRQPYVTEINRVPMQNYIDWMKSCYYISVIGLPAISVPCGFTPGGLPVGVQIVGRHHDDFGVLQLAYAFQQATGFWKQRPAIAAD
jgi:amidase